eukprot:4384041-Prymnesium_polylepis.2
MSALKAEAATRSPRAICREGEGEGEGARARGTANATLRRLAWAQRWVCAQARRTSVRIALSASAG